MQFRKALLSLALAALVVGVSFVPVAMAGSASNFAVNSVIDEFMRGQNYTGPTTVYLGLATSTGSPAGCGTEATYTGYTRVAVAATLTNWAGTQSPGSTGVSSGTSGTTSNNIVVTWGAPTSGPTVVTELCLFDASTGGHLLWRTPLTTAKTLNSGDASPSGAIAAISWTIN